MDVIGFATESRFPEGYLDDAAVRPAFLSRGLEPVPVIWDDPAVDWGRFRAVILRSPWDYVAKAAAFLAWLDALPVPVWNPKEIVRWNLTKTYLQDLETRGVPVLPTAVLQPGGDLGAVLAERGWPEVVVKPLVGAGDRPQGARHVAARRSTCT